MLDPITLKALVLAGLAFHGVTLVLYVLARQLQIGIERHDLVRAAKQQRIDYLKNMDERREALNLARAEMQSKPLGLASHARGDYDDAPAGHITPATPAAKAA